jgi:hypothetical protein
MISWPPFLRRRRTARPAVRRFRLTFEGLEDRCVPATFFVSPTGNDGNSGLAPG